MGGWGMFILEHIRKWAENDPARLAYRSGQACLTYSELEEQANRLASWISQTIGEDQSPVVVYGHMEPEIIVAFLACVKAGHPYIPIDISVPFSRLHTILDDSKTPLILSPRSLPDSVTENSVQILEGEAFKRVLLSHDIKPLLNPVKSDETFYIIYTSGTTGNPKGVQITGNCLESFVPWAIEAFKLHFENGIYLNQAPFSFDLSVMDIYPCLVTGGTIWAVTEDVVRNPRQLFHHLEESQLTVWTSTPSFAEMCLYDPTFNADLLPNLERFLFCGEVLPKKTAEMLLDRFPEAKVFNSYGPTECTVAVTCLEITEAHLNSEALPVGYCKPDSEIRIIDEAGNRLPDGEKGEIVIIGPSVSKGYLGKPTLTKRFFFKEKGKRGYRTGDAGVLKDGLLHYKGRMDFQIKLNGYRMELEEIEHHLREVSYVQQAVIVPVFEEGRCQSLTAYVIPYPHSFEKDYQLTSAIKKDLANALPKYMVPRKFVYVQTLPMTNNGKVNRQALMEDLYA